MSVHLSRTHDVYGAHGPLSLKTVQEFFPLLSKRRWAKAETFLELTVKKLGDDEWVRGYVHALSGMIAALKCARALKRTHINKDPQNL